eukprot:2876487-Prymnesium_polylepis.1
MSMSHVSACLMFMSCGHVRAVTLGTSAPTLKPNPNPHPVQPHQPSALSPQPSAVAPGTNARRRAAACAASSARRTSPAPRTPTSTPRNLPRRNQHNT